MGGKGCITCMLGHTLDLEPQGSLEGGGRRAVYKVRKKAPILHPSSRRTAVVTVIELGRIYRRMHIVATCPSTRPSLPCRPHPPCHLILRLIEAPAAPNLRCDHTLCCRHWGDLLQDLEWREGEARWQRMRPE